MSEEKGERKFSQEQFDMLKRCSEKKDMTEWNEWRINNPGKDVLLEEAPLNKSYLKGALLNKGEGEWDNKEYDFTGEVCLIGAHLENAELWSAHLENARLWDAHLENAGFEYAHMENAGLEGAHLENTALGSACLENADLEGAHLENANLLGTYLKNANFVYAHLEYACLNDSYIKGASFIEAFLQNTEFQRAIVDGETLVWMCSVDKHITQKNNGTDFSGVGLESIRIDPDTKQLLKYNIRRMNWEEWYTGESRGIENKWIQFLRKIITHPIRWFWEISDYGISTGRIIAVFFILAFIFACVYRMWSDCVILSDRSELRGFVHALYFSVVTMTTLGFGDIAANPDSWYGQVTLMIQVILGYVLLGALVTRFAVLFTASGPAGNFVSMDEKTKQLLAKL